MLPARPLDPSPSNDVARVELDAGVSRAMDRMRERPQDRWTVGSLAKVAFASRAAFARHFLASTGTTPLAWLTALRVSLAAKRLRSSDASLAAIAEEVGYANAFAFGRAFKRALGVSPSAFRRGETATAKLRTRAA